MSAAAILRLAYGDSVYKRAAADFGVSTNAIRWWVRFGFPAGRVEQVQRVMDARLAEQAAEIEATRKLIQRGFDEASSSRAGLGARAPRSGAEQVGEVGSGQSSG